MTVLFLAALCGFAVYFVVMAIYDYIQGKD